MERGNWREELLKDLEIDTKDKAVRDDFDVNLGLLIELVARHSSITVPQVNMFKLYYICGMKISDIVTYMNTHCKQPGKAAYTEADVNNAVTLTLNAIKNCEYIESLTEGTDVITSMLKSSLYELHRTKKRTVISTVQRIQSSPDFKARNSEDSSVNLEKPNLTLSLDNRVRNILLRNGITNIEQLVGMKISDVERFQSLGSKALDQIVSVCSTKGIHVSNGYFVKQQV
jgi:hypothetical protein